jgi:ATP:corrinoid adenosyltransferase
MNTILLIPTGEGVGLTSACLGMIYALDCKGINAGFSFHKLQIQRLTALQHCIVIFST